MSSLITAHTLKQMKAESQRFSCLTAYDASFAQLVTEAGVEVILVGDSLGMVVQGQESTLPVTMEETIYHCRAVRRASGNSLVMADMPFMSCNTPIEALYNAGRLMKEGGAHMVKLEGGAAMAESVKLLSQHGVPVCSHLGLLPQSVYKIGGYKVQGRDEASAEAMLADALALQQVGADMLLLECVPAALAKRISEAVEIPVIGIGAGGGCDGQVLVIYDMLGITPGKRPKFSKNFLQEAEDIPSALRNYAEAVKSGAFPTEQQSF